MAGTGKVPRKPGEGGGGEAAGAGKGPEDEKIPPVGWAVLGVSILLMLVGGLMCMMQFFWAGARTGWLVGGFVLLLGGVVALSYFFDKWGKL